MLAKTEEAMNVSLTRWFQVHFESFTNHKNFVSLCASFLRKKLWVSCCRQQQAGWEEPRLKVWVANLRKASPPSLSYHPLQWRRAWRVGVTQARRRHMFLSADVRFDFSPRADAITSRCHNIAGWIGGGCNNLLTSIHQWPAETGISTPSIPHFISPSIHSPAVSTWLLNVFRKGKRPTPHERKVWFTRLAVIFIYLFIILLNSKNLHC